MAGLRGAGKPDATRLNALDEFLREHKLRDEEVARKQEQHDKQIAELAQMRADLGLHSQQITEIRTQGAKAIEDLRSELRELRKKVDDLATREDLREMNSELRELRTTVYGVIASVTRIPTPS